MGLAYAIHLEVGCHGDNLPPGTCHTHSYALPAQIRPPPPLTPTRQSRSRAALNQQRRGRADSFYNSAKFCPKELTRKQPANHVSSLSVALPVETNSYICQPGRAGGGRCNSLKGMLRRIRATARLNKNYPGNHLMPITDKCSLMAS